VISLQVIDQKKIWLKVIIGCENFGRKLFQTKDFVEDDQNWPILRPEVLMLRKAPKSGALRYGTAGPDARRGAGREKDEESGP
jgi:hypothetical protein